MSRSTRSPFAIGSLDVTDSTLSFQNVCPQIAVSSTTVGEGGHDGVLAAGQCLPQVLLEGTRPHPVAHGSGGLSWLSMVTHTLMMSIGAWSPYPCSAAAHRPPPTITFFGHVPTSAPSCHQLLTHLMFGQDGKEALTVSREVSDPAPP